MVPSAKRATYSIVAACYRAERFLDDFFNSIEIQAVGDDELELIVVDDGSDDGTLAALEGWKARSRFSVTVLHKPNGGQASARNLGMEHATGEWLTFTDPDDWLDRDYFASIGAFIEAHPDVKQVVAQLVPMHEQPDGRLQRRAHPLDSMFDGDRLHNLMAEPDYFSGSAPASFIRADLVREFGLTFDTEIRPNFEDAHFVAKYLLSCPEPLLGLVGSAKYYYRKRWDGSSTLQTSLSQPSRYTVVPERAYLDLLDFARQKNDGSAPEWAQNLILYDLSWYFSSVDAASGVVTAAVGEVAEVFIGHLARLSRELSPAVIRAFNVRRYNPAWRQILLHSFTGEDWSTGYVVLADFDAGRDEVRLVFRFVGEVPEVEVLSGAQPVDLSEAKIRSIIYFEHELLREWACWVPAARDLVMFKNSKPMEMLPSWRGPTRYRLTPTQVRSFRRAVGHGPDRARPTAVDKVRTVLGSRRQIKRVSRKYAAIARNAPVIARLRAERREGPVVPVVRSTKRSDRPARSEFEDAWVLLDRVHNANDSAEVLFRYLRLHRRDVNAWFTVESTSPDFARLRADGFGDHVVAYGSERWKLMMAHAKVIISSHADGPIFNPPALAGIEVPQWRRAFLNHGVIKDDLSAWLNPKRLDLFVVSTEDELQSIIGDHTAYRYSGRETKLTGMPRLDQLQQARTERESAGQDKDLVVVAPTWRHWLLQAPPPGSQRRELIPDFEESEFVALWSEFVSNDEIARACDRHGLRLVMLPHPNLERALGTLNRLSGIETLSYDRPDLHAMFARTAMMVTDYSSVAFNIAYLESPTVYFQFDADRMFSGQHVGRKGYFDYPAMGFGPVAYELDGAIEATVEMITSVGESGQAPEPWQSRIIETFPFRDGRCSERVANEVDKIVAATDRTEDDPDLVR